MGPPSEGTFFILDAKEICFKSYCNVYQIDDYNFQKIINVYPQILYNIF